MASHVAPRISLQKFFDANDTLSSRQRIVVALAFLALLSEGLDIVVASFVYPELVRGWHTSLEAITFVVTASMLGMALGAAAAGPLADRFGRKGIVVAGIILFSLTTAGSGLPNTFDAFAILRIAAGVGLGAAMPVVMTMVAELIPSRRRAQMVTLSFSGVAFGTVLGGFLASAIIPSLGWPALLLICGLGLLFLAPAIALLVPEPPAALIARGRSDAEARRALQRIAPGRDTSNVELKPAGDIAVDRPHAAVTVFARQQLPTTLLLWLTFFIGLGVAFLILNYLPLMIRQQGLTAAQTGIVIGVFGWGAVVGQLLASLALRWLDRFRVLAALWALGLVEIWVVAAFTLDFTGYLVTVFGIGLFIPSANAALNGIGALAYPTSARATGMGLASTAGRAGIVVSGLLGGLMVSAGWSTGQIFMVLSVPIVTGIMAAWLMRAARHRHEKYNARTVQSDGPETSTSTI